MSKGTTYSADFEPVTSKFGLRVFAALGELEAATRGGDSARTVYWAGKLVHLAGKLADKSVRVIASVMLDSQQGDDE